jgi:hypothetical protein
MIHYHFSKLVTIVYNECIAEREKKKGTLSFHFKQEKVNLFKLLSSEVILKMINYMVHYPYLD